MAEGAAPQYLRLRRVDGERAVARASDWWRYAGPATPRAFGGQLAAHCITAAGIAAPRRWVPISLHLVFVREGRLQETEYRVTTVREGRSFAVYDVRAIERHAPAEGTTHAEASAAAADRELARAIVSYQHIDIEPSTAPLHHAPMPTARPPDDCRVTHFGEFGIRFADDTGLLYWIKWDAPTPLSAAHVDGGTGDHRPGGDDNDGGTERAAALAFLSDLWVAYAPMRTLLAARCADAKPYALGPAPLDFHRLGGRQTASLDHTIHFNTVHVERWRGAEWLLFDLSTAFAAAGRGLIMGRVWSESGALLATFTQDALFRVADGFPCMDGDARAGAATRGSALPPRPAARL